MQVPLVQSLLPQGKRVGVLTISAATLSPDHLRAAGAPSDLPVVGTDEGREFTRVILGDEPELDVAAAEQDILDAGDRLIERHPEIGGVVLECTNMAPYARALSERLKLPVFDVVSLVTWFHAGLAPRDFGPPASGPRAWDER
jgi:Asp/Glu/hydantoin racemase